MPSLYWRLEQRIAPGLRFSQEHYVEVLRAHVQEKARWLDLGCGWKIFPEGKLEQEKQLLASCGLVVGMDGDFPAIAKHRSLTHRVCGDIEAHLPFQNECFDLATANMVLEHIKDPLHLFDGIYRVLRPGGKFIFHTPNALGWYVMGARLLPDRAKRFLARKLEHRNEVDVYRTYYQANTGKELLRLARAARFEKCHLLFVRTNALFHSLAPLGLAELLWLRILDKEPLRGLRPNIIGICLKERS